MRTRIWLGSFLFASGCGGLSAKDYCEERVRANCAWYVQCGQTALTVEECAGQLSEQEGCASATAATTCEAGLRFDGVKAEACVDSVAKTPCAEGAPGGAACDAICQP